MNSWDIELSSWILMDGNYDTTSFELGQTVRFAVEFYLPHFSICSGSPALKPVAGQPSFYDAVAEVIFQKESLCVLNLGQICAFRSPFANEVRVGQFVRGKLSLHVDPFMYYESLHEIPAAPPLVYEWLIDGIDVDLTPLVEDIDERGPRVMRRDETRVTYEPVDRVDASYLIKSKIQAIGSWVLHCSKLDRPPVKTI